MKTSTTLANNYIQTRLTQTNSNNTIPPLHKQLQINKLKQYCNMKILTNNQKASDIETINVLAPNFDKKTQSNKF
jgi:hypothetical protein